MDTLPLFPLNTVLFPGQLLPLHIFEPRYRQLIGECIEHGRPFGVVLIHAGEEVGDEAEPHEVGTTAHIVQVERMPDGRMNILCVGNARFRIEETFHDKPYLYGAIELWPWTPLAPGAVNVDLVRKRLGRYLHLLAQMTDSKIDADLPTDPASLANIAASVLQVDMDEKQQLLTTNSIGEMLTQISDLLQRELRGLQIVQASRQAPPDEVMPFSLN